MLDAELAMKQFNRRFAQFHHQRVDNSLLPDDVPKYRHCFVCGVHLTDSSESKEPYAGDVCHPCQVLRNHGLL